MNKTLALLCGTALAVAATVTYAQNTPPGTDRPGGESSGQSAQPSPDKKGPMTKKGTTGAGTPQTGGGNPTPPGTDRPGGESGGQSAKPMPDKK